VINEKEMEYLFTSEQAPCLAIQAVPPSNGAQRFAYTQVTRAREKCQLSVLVALQFE
jgi:hypothetical protein